jgi:hypothetical protein
MSLTTIKNIAEEEFESFIDMLHADYPELILKYQINKTMKTDFIEAVIRQVWVNKQYDKIDILEFMINRGNR